MLKVSSDFPILRNSGVIYLDNAATTQKPRQVIEAVSDFYKEANSNVHRGMHRLSQRATEEYEGAREKVARFIGAKDASEIIFTKNATESLNLASYSIRKMVQRRPRVLTTPMEHHSNLVPWQQNGQVSFIPLDKGKSSLDWEKSVANSKKADVLAISGASNVLGTINPIQEISASFKERNPGAIVVVDGAQSVPNLPTDVGKLGADLLAFSSHKMLGPTGIGVLWGRMELLEKLPPFLYGGDMISSVSLKSARWNRLPWKFEAGTPPIAEAVGLGAAVDYLSKIGMKRVRAHEQALTKLALSLLRENEGVYVHGPLDSKRRTGLVSFTVRGVHPHDVAEILDSMGIAIRSGHHCAEPLSKILGVPGTARASFHIYNTKREVRELSEALGSVGKIFFRRGRGERRASTPSR